ncbi:hypothetical protein [Sphingobacterium thalpophilum]|uniref:Uncharacterized protein n=1 Tax=Sphingobacterium thalpophilum TaxID=259 RepID=A0A4U9UJE8_9SPHI|nr:hypothetical protein [Sphingobacterium thalpophilum]VTR29704.1 Uncharacterised protein [Sphingobacterium thalpophilum]
MSDINTEEPNWESIILILHAHTRRLLQGKTWFRGKNPTSFLKGKEIDDYVFDAIGRYLENPQKYDPLKGSLEDYLKYNIVRTLVSNDIRSDENKTTKDVFGMADTMADGDNAESYIESIFPVVEAFFDQQIDYENVMSEIADAVQGQNDVEQIFVSVYGFGMKRREIIKEFEMDESTYDNAFRRLKTIIRNVVNKFDLTEHKI